MMLIYKSILNLRCEILIESSVELCFLWVYKVNVCELVFFFFCQMCELVLRMRNINFSNNFMVKGKGINYKMKSIVCLVWLVQTDACKFETQASEQMLLVYLHLNFHLLYCRVWYGRNIIILRVLDCHDVECWYIRK